MVNPTPDTAISYAGYRFPPEVISYAVWLYYRFPLSLRMVEEMLAARSIEVTYETVRQWALTFGQQVAKRIRARVGNFGDKWHLDEVVITIKGKQHWLWRAVDENGYALDLLVQSRRNTKAAQRLMRKLLRTQGKTPRVMVTDKLKSYAAANRRLGLKFEHRQHKGLNTGLRTRINPPGFERRSCAATSQCAICSAFCQCMTWWPSNSCTAATTATRPKNGTCVPRRSQPGTR